MIMTLPCRLMTRQRSHIGLTDGLTFIRVPSAVAIRDAAAREVVRGELDLDLVPGKDPDVALPHLSRDAREHRMSAVDLDAEHRAREGLGDLTLDFDLVLLLDHLPRTWVGIPREMRATANASRGRLIVANWSRRAWSESWGRFRSPRRCARSAQQGSRPRSRSTIRRRAGRPRGSQR